jgi:sulfur relay (sulfurtransferase) complex TusBCD TusD component (DsrE family)
MNVHQNKKQNQNKLRVFMLCVVVTATAALLGTSFFRPDLALAQETQDRPIVVHIKSGNPKDFDEVHAANMAMSLATNLQNAGKNVTVFLDTNGVNIGVQQPSFILNGTTTMLKNLIANGGGVWVCPHCLTEAGYGVEDLLEGAQIASPEQQTMAKVLSGDVIVIDY